MGRPIFAPISAMMALFFFLALSVGEEAAVAASRVTSIDFKGTSDPNQIEIRGDGPLTFQKQENAQDNQVVLEISNATLAKSASRKIDTSSFNSKVTLISPYQVEGQADTVRVVIQMREPGAVDAASDGNLIKVSVPTNGGAVTAVAPNPPSADPAPQANSDVTVQKTSATVEAPKNKLEEFVGSKASGQFTGRPITLQVRDVDVADVFRLIGEASGFNIILGDDVKGKITLSLVDVPWDQALDVILHTLRLGAERNNNILRIVTLQNLTAEKKEEFLAQQAAQASAPRVTRIFPISYANLTDMQATLTKFAATSTLGAVPDAATQPIVQADNRTNSLIIRDTPDNIERMKKLIELLDTQTPQVMIEAKVVEATEAFSKTMGGSLGFGNDLTSSDVHGTFASFNGGNPVDPLVGTPGVFSDGSKLSQSTSGTSGGSGGFGLSPSANVLPLGFKRLNMLLNIGESENQVKVVSAPKTVVLNKEKASIVQGTPVLVPGTTTVTATGPVTTSAIQSANLSLSVKPTVTNDGSVLMDLTVTRDIPFSLGGNNSGVANRNMNTIVLVESGSTLVIGGIYTMTSTKASSGFPFLRKIPILGMLFGSESDSTDRSELFIFITPRILNLKEAGLNGAST